MTKESAPFDPGELHRIGGEAREQTKEFEPVHKVALITTTQVDLGIKSLAGALKKEGFEVGKFNLPKEDGYSQEELDQIIKKLNGYDVVGISVTDMGFQSRALPLIREIKEKLKKPVVLGGVHAVLDPIGCLKTGADAVCLGEGDYDFTNLLKNWHTRKENPIRNFIVAKEDIDWNDEQQITALQTEIARLREMPIENIDELSSDFGYHDYWFLKDGKLTALTPETMEDYVHHQIGHKKTLVYASDRGCPSSCTYCYNKNMRQTYTESAASQEVKFKKYYRKKSVSIMVKELELLITENPQVRFINLMNDDMAARTVDELTEFARLYKERIGLPFYCMVSPRSISGDKGSEKIHALIEAGLVELNLGIQTNEKTNREIFNRQQSDEDIIEIMQTLNPYCRKDTDREEKGKIDVFIDFIIHNPFESEEDIKRTVELVKRLPTPFDYVAHTLYVGKATVLREMLERKKVEASKKGELVDRVLEDVAGESDYHDTYKFYDWLKDNRNFVINTICEFMAGRHDEKMTGRIPRYVRDLFEFPIFKDLLAQSPGLKDIIEEINMPGSALFVDLLTHGKVLKYFKENKTPFKIFFERMNGEAKIIYTNQRDLFEE